MSSNYTILGTDLDSKLEAIESYAKRSDVGYKVAGTDISNRYAPSAIVQDRGPSVGYNVLGTDIGPLFRDFRCPTVTLTGPTSVPVGGGGGNSWDVSAVSASTLTGVRFYVVGHGAGAWSFVGGTTYNLNIPWANPFGSPDIAGSAGGPYTFIFEAGNSNGFVGHTELQVTVV